MDMISIRRKLMAMQNKPAPTGYVTDGLVLWLDGINKGNTPNAWDDLINGYSFSAHDPSKVVFGEDFVEFLDNNESYLYNADFDAPNYQRGTIEIVYDTHISHAQILFNSKSLQTLSYGVGAGSVIWVKNEYGSTGSNMYKYPRFTSGSVSVSLTGAYYDGITQQNTGTDIWGDNARNYSLVGKTYYRDDRCFGGKIYCIRIYNRQLTQSEVRNNYLVDRQRFSLFQN